MAKLAFAICWCFALAATAIAQQIDCQANFDEIVALYEEPCASTIDEALTATSSEECPSNDELAACLRERATEWASYVEECGTYGLSGRSRPGYVLAESESEAEAESESGGRRLMNGHEAEADAEAEGEAEAEEAEAGVIDSCLPEDVLESAESFKAYLQG
jgi:hypothetical protein